MTMKIITKTINLATKSNPELINITGQLEDILGLANVKEGSLTVFVVGSTAAITTLEYEPGLIKDISELYEKIIPEHKHYHHDDTWNDANGYSHLRASLTGPSLTIPFKDAKLLLGTWQQVALIEFDNRPRKRQIVVQLMGE